MTRDRKGQTLTHFPNASSPLLLSPIASIASNLVFLMTAYSLPHPFANSQTLFSGRGCQHLCATVAVDSRPLVVFSLQCGGLGCWRHGRAWLSVMCAHVRGNRAPVPQGAISPSIIFYCLACA